MFGSVVEEYLASVKGYVGFEGKVYKVEYIDPIRNKLLLLSEDSRREINLEEILPKGYERALDHCKTCGGCCRRGVVENEAFAGLEQ